MAEALGSVTDMAIAGIFPWCLTPELYAARPEYIESLADFVRSRPMPPVDAPPPASLTPTQGIGGSTEATVFEDCAHAPIYENVEAFNQRTLEFLHHHPA